MEREREAYWQSAWAEVGLATAKRVPGREKFYAIVAYPGASGFIHLGHLRGLLIADALHRYYRMNGRQVFFPTGTHASGLPAVTFAQKVQRRDPTVVQQLRDNGVPEADWTNLEDPSNAARFLGESYLATFRRMGLLIDRSAYVTTIDDDYQAFIRWQFHRLAEKGALVQAPHFAAVCPVCGPVSVDASETDLSSGGDADWTIYTTVPFRLDDGRILLAATLRPETIFGVTNVWLHPAESLVVWHHEDHEYLLGERAAHRMAEQHGGRIGAKVEGSHLLGRTVKVPISGASVPIVPSPIVDPNLGTGVVMSVPAHAPADWLALAALPAEERAHLPPIREIIELPDPEALSTSERELNAGSGVPAERAVRATHAATLADAAAVEAATERLYRLEHAKGRMRSDLLGGVRVPEARDLVAAELKREAGAMELQQFSKPVICRNGHEVVIRRVPDQWFIRYSEPSWKASTHALVRRTTVRPEEYQRELPSVIDWFNDRPCTRRGRWLGTPFPTDPSWIIEPIADSTFYPAYFVVRRAVSSGRVSLAGLTDSFFDFIFLGTGDGESTVDAELQRELREEFLYWYPLDLNIGGKEHKRVHFPAYLYTHALLLPEVLQPRGLFVNWWLTGESGAKISKKDVSSKGGRIPPIHNALEQWGADALRLFYALSASPHQDVEWEPALADRAGDRLLEIERLVTATRVPGGGGPPELDAWLTSVLHSSVREARTAFESGALRDAAEIVYVRLPTLLRRYYLRGGSNGIAVSAFESNWIRLLSPITPHVAEELGQGRFPGLVAERSFPRPDDLATSEVAVAEESYLERVEEDLRSVLKPSLARGETPTAVAFFVADEWKRSVDAWIRDWADAGAEGNAVRFVMERARSHAPVQSHLSEIAAYVQRVAPLIREAPSVVGPSVDEVKVLRSGEGYLARRFGFERVSVFREAEGEAHDPLGRRGRSRPGQPAFYLLGHRPTSPPSAGGAERSGA